MLRARIGNFQTITREVRKLFEIGLVANRSMNSINNMSRRSHYSAYTICLKAAARSIGVFLSIYMCLILPILFIIHMVVPKEAIPYTDVPQYLILGLILSLAQIVPFVYRFKIDNEGVAVKKGLYMAKKYSWADLRRISVNTQSRTADLETNAGDKYSVKIIGSSNVAQWDFLAQNLNEDNHS